MRDEPCFQISPHNKEPPYVLINRSLIRDRSITPNCRWMLIFILTSEPGTLTLESLRDHTRGSLEEEEFHSIIKEAIESGYIKKEKNGEMTITDGENGKFNPWS